MSREHALSVLSSKLADGSLSPRDVSFASSLVSQAETRGLSEKQWYWVEKLSATVTAPDKKALPSYGRVYALFLAARQHLKYPKITLSLPSGREIKLYLSGQRSRVPDTINVTSGDAWYGRVFSDGSWEAGRSDDGLPEIEEALASLAEDPVTVAATSGHLSGNCAFCNRPLTDARSTSVGFGPVCAKNYGLDWG